MPLLDRHGAKAEIWARSEGAAIGTVSHALVEWAALPEALAQKTRDQRIGVVIPNTVRIPELKLLMRQLSLIAISFPSFGDGRGFSLARLIRNHGFTGTLRASGPLIVDQFGAGASDDFLRPLTDADGICLRFSAKWTRRYLIRNHQKLVIADGVRAMFGGFNIADAISHRQNRTAGPISASSSRERRSKASTTGMPGCATGPSARNSMRAKSRGRCATGNGSSRGSPGWSAGRRAACRAGRAACRTIC